MYSAKVAVFSSTHPELSSLKVMEGQCRGARGLVVPQCKLKAVACGRVLH